MTMSGIVTLAFIATVWAQEVPSVHPRAQPADTTQVSAVIEDYFKRYEEKNPERLLELWSPSSPELERLRRRITSEFAGLDIRFSALVISRVTIDGDRASARASVDREESRLQRTHSIKSRIVRKLTLVREEGTWRFWSDQSAAEDLAEELIRTRDEAERASLLAREQDLVGNELAEALSRSSDRRFIGGDYGGASVGYRLVLNLGETINPSFRNRAMHNLANLAYMRRDYPAALKAYEELLTVGEKSGDGEVVASAVRGLATVHYSEGRYSQALPLYERALALLRTQDDPFGLASVLVSLGNIQYLLGNYELALRSYQEVSSNALLNESAEKARALQGEGRVNVALGNYQRALEVYATTLALSEAVRDQASVSTTLTDIGRVYYLQGDLETAQRQYERSLAIEESLKNQAGQGRVLLGLGLILAARNDLANALKAYDASFAVFQNVDGQEGMGYALLGAASVRVNQRDLEEAIRGYQQALVHFDRAKDQEGTARGHLGLSIAGVEKGEPSEALTAAERALEISTTAGLSDLIWQAHFRKGKALLGLGERLKARDALEEAIVRLEATRMESGVSGTDATSIGDRAAPYLAMMEWSMAGGDGAQALMFAQRARTRGLQDLLQGFRYHITKGMTDEERAQERALNNQRISLSIQDRRERQVKSPDQVRLDDLAGRLTEARKASAAFESKLYEAHPAVMEERGEVPPLSLKDISAVLKEDEVVLKYIVVELHTFLFVITSGPEVPSELPRLAIDSPPVVKGLAAFRLKVSRIDLTERISRFNQLLALRSPLLGGLSAELSELLLGPAKTLLQGKKTWIIVPDSALWRVPFEALQTAPDSHVIDQAAIVYAPSIRAWRYQSTMRETRALAGKPRHLSVWKSERELGEPKRFKLDPKQLPTSLVLAEEVRSVREMYSLAQVQIVDPAGRDGAQLTGSALDGRPVLHVALPVILNDVSPLYSAIVTGVPPDLKPNETADGVIEAWELLRMDLKFDVAVLGAAILPPSRTRGGEALAGMSWSFLVAGCPTVVTGRWRPAGLAPRRLLTELHRELKKGPAATGANPGSIARALRQAMLKLRRSPDFSHPYYWASLSVFGAP